MSRRRLTSVAGLAFLVAVAVAAGLVMAACVEPEIDEGFVIDRYYDDPDAVTSLQCSYWQPVIRQANGFTSGGGCGMWVPVTNVMPERWLLVIQDCRGTDWPVTTRERHGECLQGEVQVDVTTWGNTSIGDFWPSDWEGRVPR